MNATTIHTELRTAFFNRNKSALHLVTTDNRCHCLEGVTPLDVARWAEHYYPVELYVCNGRLDLTEEQLCAFAQNHPHLWRTHQPTGVQMEYPVAV